MHPPPFFRKGVHHILATVEASHPRNQGPLPSSPERSDHERSESTGRNQDVVPPWKPAGMEQSAGWPVSGRYGLSVRHRAPQLPASLAHACQTHPNHITYNAGMVPSPGTLTTLRKQALVPLPLLHDITN